MRGRPNLDLDRPRSVGEMLSGALDLYRQFPFLFLALAAIVIVPYELVVLAITGTGPYTQHLGFVASQELLVTDSFIAAPLISALHVNAVREVGDGGRPGFAATFRRSLPRLPVVAAAAGISGVAIGLGYFALAVPGLFLAAVWSVVAQAAALENGNPIDALRRSFALTRGYRWHSLGLVICAGLVAFIPGIPLVGVFRHSATTACSFVIGTAAQVILRSFEALVTALLYFDLAARERLGHQGIEPPPMPRKPARPSSAGGVTTAPTRSTTHHPADPFNWSDDDRPAGWYVNPTDPKRMRYWATDGSGTGVWTGQSTKTPKQLRAEWDAFAAAGGDEGT